LGSQDHNLVALPQTKTQ